MANNTPEHDRVALESAEEVRFDALRGMLNDLGAQVVPEEPPAPAPGKHVLDLLRTRGLLQGNHFFCYDREPAQPTLIVTDFEGMHGARAGSKLIEAMVMAGKQVRHYVIDDISGDVVLFPAEYEYTDNSQEVLRDALTPPLFSTTNLYELKISSGEEYRKLITRRGPGVRFMASQAAASQLEADILTFDEQVGRRAIPYRYVSWQELFQAEVTELDEFMIDIDS